MEFTVMKCIFKQNYTELLKKFGIDKVKTTYEVEKFLGRKINQPN
jgi:hypothetical protein